MTIHEYRNFELLTGMVMEDAGGGRRFAVQVLRSPAGDSPPITSNLSANYQRRMNHLENRHLAVDEIQEFGRELGEALFPEPARGLLQTSLAMLQPNQGLRILLRLDPTLTDVPWEYVYLPRVHQQADAMGYLSLDPRLSIVRREAIGLPAGLDTAPRERRVLMALASPAADDLDPLDLERERDNLRQALEDVPKVRFDPLMHATTESLADALRLGADIFHFAGHGDFQRTGLGERLGTITGQGEILLEGPHGEKAPMEADQLANNLRGREVQLVVLGACRTGRRDGHNLWSSVAAALLAAEIPVVLAMQYKIWDDSAIAFSRGFYRALATGLTVDQAVAEGRLAIFNLCHPQRDDPVKGVFWRDWGVPVLYNRADQDFVLPAVSDPPAKAMLVDELQQARQSALTQVRTIRVGDISNVFGGEINIAGGDIIRDQSRIVDTGGGAYVEGSVQTGGGDFTGRDSFQAHDQARIEVQQGGAALAEVFANLVERTQELSAQNQALVRLLLEQAQATAQEIQQGQDTSEKRGFLAERLRNLVAMAPEIGKVAVATLASPPAGVALAIQLIAQKVEQESQGSAT